VSAKEWGDSYAEMLSSAAHPLVWHMQSARSGQRRTSEGTSFSMNKSCMRFWFRGLCVLSLRASSWAK